jgi:hypothetical protein
VGEGQEKDEAIRSVATNKPLLNILSARPRPIYMRWQAGWSSRSKPGERLTLTRTADVAPVREQGLTLAEAEKLRETWKSRGPHGG